jgi:hypothetical protein
LRFASYHFLPKSSKFKHFQGCKLAETSVVYTIWPNLKKTGDMVTGQVEFHSNRAVKKVGNKNLHKMIF